MTLPRRFLPSTSALRALEAVDRLGTATAAALELSLTHSAVSRQLKTLEDQLGVALFHRQGKQLSLTPAGQDYAKSVREFLSDLAQASLRLKANASASSLSLAVLPAFGLHWLSPRLRHFADAHPDIVFNLTTRLSAFDFNHAHFDAAIHFGHKDWQAVDYLKLADEQVIPVAAASLLQTAPLAGATELLSLPLLHLESRPGAWEDWFAWQDCPAGQLRGMLFDQFAQMAEAAALGFGVALLPTYLADAEIRKGRVMPAFHEPMPTPGAYYLVWPGNKPPRPPLQKLIDWLSATEAP